MMTLNVPDIDDGYGGNFQDPHLNVNQIDNTIFDNKQQVSLAWRNLRYEVNDSLIPFSNKRKTILQRLTGHVKYGSLNGFMGPSGAGKTTLLNCLNGNIKQFANGTELYLNKNENIFPRLAFVEQHVNETIVGGFTVQEVLYYAFRFKNHRKDVHRSQEHIENTLKDLLLDPNVLKRKFEQCSGGEQKRIAIAQELMSLKKPTFLFIDEPTTGLDSQAALIVMQCLRRITTDYQITLMVSIHMPNDEIIRLFDQLYILARGGICIYAGAPKYLRQNLFDRVGIRISDAKPPIEEYLKIACKGINEKGVLRMAEYTLEKQNDQLRPFREQLKYLDNGIPIRYKRFSFGDFFLQLYRLFYLNTIVNFKMILYQALIYIIYYLYMANVFDHRMIYDSNMCFKIDGGNETCSEYTERNNWANNYFNYQAHSLMFINFANMFCGVILFSPLLPIFNNEHRNRWYSMATFYWSFTLIKFLEMTFFSIFVSLMIYFPTEHHFIDNYQINWIRIWYFIFFIWIMSFYIQSCGQLLSLIFVKRMEIAVMMAPLWTHFLAMNSNYIVNLEHQKKELLIYISNIVGTKYISNGLLYAFFYFERCDYETEYNEKHVRGLIHPETLYSDLIVVAINIILLRFAAFILMFLRFSLLSRGKKQPFQQTSFDQWQIIPLIDHNNSTNNNNNNNNRSLTNSSSSSSLNMSNIVRKKSFQEIKFEHFSRNRIIVAWRNLTLFGSKSFKETRSIEQHSGIEQKLILRNLNGQFRFGTLNALMGTSGAGKTSLLKVLNGRSKTRLSDETRIYLSKYTPIRICYLTQEVSGHLWPGLTAKQSLIYASRLKNSMEKHQIESQVVDHESIAMNLLEEFDIIHTADTYSQRCSGGERKRLALAQELTSTRMPNFICIDEPTSGLDSYSADIVLQCLQKLVHKHSITIVASIHQPTTEMLMMFDYCYVLARGGVCIYADTPDNINKHLMCVQQQQQLKQDTNSETSSTMDTTSLESEEYRFPVEELIKCSCQDYRDTMVQSLNLLTNEKIIENDDNELMADTQNVVDGIQQNRNRFGMTGVCALIGRYWLHTRNHLWFHTIMFYSLYIMMAIINHTFYNTKNIVIPSGCVSIDEDFINVCNISDTHRQQESDLIGNVQYNYSCTLALALGVLLHTSVIFAMQSRYFFNEHRNGWYSSGVYYLVQCLFEMIPVIPIIMLYVYIIDIYEYVRPGIYWWLFFIYLLYTYSLQALGQLLVFLNLGILGSGSKQKETDTINLMAMLIFNMVFIIFFILMLTNFCNPISNMHYWYQGLALFSPIRWTFEALHLIQYGFERCGHKEIQVVLYSMDIFHDEHFYQCIRMLFMNLILYRTLALLLLMAKANANKNRRKRIERIQNYYQDNLSKPINSMIPGLTTSDYDFCIKRVEI